MEGVYRYCIYSRAQKKMKVIWFSSIRLSEVPMSYSGTWIEGMSDALRDLHPEVELVNVCMGRVETVHTEYARGRKQICFPYFKTVSDSYVVQVAKLLEEERPDVVEVWGVESAWGLMPFEKMIPGVPVILGIQGVMRAVRDIYFADLSPLELLRSIGIKEILRPKSSLFFTKYAYGRKTKREKAVINKFKYISSQSEWVTAHVKSINPDAQILDMRIALREPYYRAEKWKRETNPYTIFATAIMNAPLKGIYTLLRAFKEVKKNEPRARLELAGYYQNGIRRSGFHKMMERYIEKNKLIDSVIFHGQLKTYELIRLATSCGLYVNPSFVESYSLTTAEATYLGLPTIVSYAGTLPELGKDGGIVYFPKGDYVALSAEILKVMRSAEYAEELSEKAITTATVRSDRVAVSANEVEIYSQVMEGN